jgi:hypothetical protein
METKEKKIRVKFRIVNGKIHIKHMKVTPDEYKRIAEVINHVVSPDVLQKHNFNASVEVSF